MCIRLMKIQWLNMLNDCIRVAMGIERCYSRGAVVFILSNVLILLCLFICDLLRKDANAALL